MLTNTFKVINISDYNYELPAEKIAVYPLAQRDESKLLVYKKGDIVHERFRQITEYLPPGSFLFFNDTKVIPARLPFKKETGAEIEIFLLSPIKPSTLLIEAMQAKRTTTWECTIGNLKRWRKDMSLTLRTGRTNLKAKLVNKEKGVVEFNWDSEISFAEIISQSGETPLPPYLKRKVEPADRDRYQTIYSHFEGAVAAPTAGLHFTDHVFDQLTKKNIQHDFLTLHVSAGTFQPVKSEDVSEHVMHHEQIIINKKNLENILSNDFIIPVGTTSMRTLESVYWYGVKLQEDSDAPLIIEQQYPYRPEIKISKQQAIENVLSRMENSKTETLVGETSIFIKPGYRFRICNSLITNFHQPGSTLILLVAAFVGEDWKKIYNEALQNNYRFLSYGDSSLLMP